MWLTLHGKSVVVGVWCAGGSGWYWWFRGTIKVRASGVDWGIKCNGWGVLVLGFLDSGLVLIYTATSTGLLYFTVFPVQTISLSFSLVCWSQEASRWSARFLQSFGPGKRINDI